MLVGGEHRADQRPTGRTQEHRMPLFADPDLLDRLEEFIATQADIDGADCHLLRVIQHGHRHIEHVEPQLLVEDEVAHVDLTLAPVESCLPPLGLALIVFGLRRGTHHQGPLAVRHEDGDVFRFPDPQPFIEIVRRHLVDEIRVLVLARSHGPPPLPFTHDPANGRLIPSHIAPVRIDDRAA